MNILSIARMTLLEAWRGKVLWLTAFFAFVMVTLTYALSEYIHSSDIATYYKLLIDGGLSTLSMGLFIIAIFFTFQTIINDKKQKTLPVLLSMPLPRHSYVLGKFLGIAATIFESAILFCGILLVTLGFFIHHQLEHAHGNLQAWIPLVVWASLAFALAACMQAVGVMILCFVMESEFLILFSSFGLWGLGALSHDFRQLAEDAQTWIQPVLIGVYHLLPDFSTLNFLSDTAYQVSASSSEMALVCLYGVSYVLVVLMVFLMILAKKDIT